MQHLFPIMFVDFDGCTVGAFYYDGICMERYVPNNGAVNSLILLINILKKNSLVQISLGTRWADLLALLNKREPTAYDRLFENISLFNN